MNYTTLTALAASLTLAGCMNLAPAHHTPLAPVPETVSTDATADAAQATAPALEQAQALTWVQAPALQQVLALALSHNRDLKIAWFNIEKARAQYGVQQADLLPTLAASGQGNRSRSSADLSPSGNAATSSQFSAQLGFTSYELDLWGRVRNLNEAGLQQFLQTSINQRSVAITLLADVANAWLTLAADQARLELAQNTLTSQRKAFELTQRMHALGATSGLVLAQNQTIVDKARADVAGFASQVDKSRNALQLLVGATLPVNLLPPALDSAMPPTAALLELPTPLPSSRLLARPDIQAAEHALRAATANIGAARAALFPSISLTAAAGSASRDLSGLFGGGNGTWSFAPQIRLPLVAATQKVLTLSEARFKSGADNYLSVLDAQRSLYAAQQTQIALRLAEQANRITLYKVLGGG